MQGWGRISKSQFPTTVSVLTDSSGEPWGIGHTLSSARPPILILEEQKQVLKDSNHVLDHPAVDQGQRRAAGLYDAVGRPPVVEDRSVGSGRDVGQVRLETDRSRRERPGSSSVRRDVAPTFDDGPFSPWLCEKNTAKT